MESFSIKQADGSTLDIDGIPEAKIVVTLNDSISRQIADCALHKADLDFVLDFLGEINRTESEIAREALWHSAVIRFVKCFDSGTARTRLHEDVIYKDSPPAAMENFRYFKNLRNKTIVHDENSYTQCTPCAAINDGTKSFKVEKVLSLIARGVTLDQNNYQNLHLLATQARAWVMDKFDKLCDRATVELEKETYGALVSRKIAAVTVPAVEQVGVRRSAFGVPRP